MTADWMADAACAGRDPELFFDARHRAKAQAICSRCPVAQRCREVGADEYRGVWGGVVNMRNKVGPSTVAPYLGVPHGTERGYAHHLHHGTPPCGACSTAHMHYGREMNAKYTRVRTPDQLEAQKKRRQERRQTLRQQRARGIA